MSRLKRLSGAEVIAILERFDFQIYSQRGSHVKLRRMSEAGKETLTVPNHRQLDTGTCRAVYRQACRYISEVDLFRYFYE